MYFSLDDEDHSLPWTTTERQDLVQKYYPTLVEEYEKSIKKPVKEKNPRGRKKKDLDEQGKPEKPKRKYSKKVKELINDVENLSRSLDAMNISKTKINTSKANVSVKVNKLKRKQKKTIIKKQKTIESFINKRRKSKIESLRYSFRDSKCDNDDEFDLITNEYKENKAEAKPSANIINLTKDEINDSDLSDIVDKIVKKAPVSKTAKVDNNTVRLIFERKFSTPKKSAFRKSVLNEICNNCSTPRDSPARRESFSNNFSKDSISKVNTSYFFDKLTDDCDAFEMSLDNKRTDYDSDKTEDYNVTIDISLPNCQI